MSSDGRASQETLHALHNATAEGLLRKIRSGEATAADFAAASKFLKDNSIEQPRLPGTPAASLADELPFAGMDGSTH